MDQNSNKPTKDQGLNANKPQEKSPPMQNSQTNGSFSTQYPDKTAQSFENANNINPPTTVVNAPPSELKSIPKEAKIISEKTQSGSESVYAPLSIRYFAVMVDSLIITMITLLFNFPSFYSLFQSIRQEAAVPEAGTFYQQQFVSSGEDGMVFTALAFIGWLISALYPLYFIGRTGATPGKALFKIAVVDKETEAPPGFLKAFLREFVGKFISSIALGLGYLTAIKDPHKQTWHDKIAGTVVVRV